MYFLSILKEALLPLSPIAEIKNEKHALTLLCYNDATEAHYKRCISALAQLQATEYAANRIGDNFYATYVKDDNAVQLSYYGCCRELRVILGRRCDLPPACECEKNGEITPTLTQIGLTVEGASHVVHLSDGRFLLLDGGIACDEEIERLYAFLKARTEKGQKPHIAAWLISHAHNDHIHLCQEFLKRYHDEIVLDLFGYNFPDYQGDLIADKGSSPRWQAQMAEILDTNFKNTARWTPHSGERLILPGCTAEVLCTWEDYWPQIFGNINQTSLCLRLCFESGKIALMPTDAWYQQAAKMTAQFGAYLKCDVLQAAHHGLAGGHIPFYEQAAPEVVLWATPHWRFAAEQEIFVEGREKPIKVTRSFEPSRYLIANAGRHYTHKKTVTLNMNDLSEV